MRHAAKVAVLAVLVVVSVGLTIALFGMSRAAAQPIAGENVNMWRADDPGRAVATLYDTLSYGYHDQTYLPGMYGNSPLSVNIRGWATFPGLYGATRDNSLAYSAIQSPDPTKAYERQNPTPKVLWTPKMGTENKLTQGTQTLGSETPGEPTGMPVLQIDAQPGTKFQGPDGRMLEKSLTTSMSVLTSKLATPATKFGISLKSETKNGQIVLTYAQLRALLMEIQEAQKGDGGNVRARFQGSLNDQVAKFVLMVRIRYGMATDFRIVASDPPEPGSPQR